MNISNLAIDGLSIDQKLSLMERIWSDLEKRPDEIPSPDWHGDILAKRLTAVENGDIDFVDWEDARTTLLSRFDANKDSA